MLNDSGNMLSGDTPAALAAAYLSVGSRQKAVDLLQKTVVDFPSQKDQAQYYIREIQAGRNP